jgi:hypothetical protein
MAAEPVPAINTMAGPVPVAASAISKSVQTLITTLGNAAASDTRILSAAFTAPTPAIPAHKALIASGFTRASNTEACAAFFISSTARSNPTSPGFDGPDRPEARMFPAPSIKTHSVLVAPPSKPSMQRM